MKQFLESRKDNWSRLEQLTARASRLRLAKLSGEEVREFGRLYRRTAADLAIAREEVKDKRLVNYLNHLVGRAHGAIYRSESSGFGGIIDFFRFEFPALFRQHCGMIFLAFAIFMVSAIFSGVTSYVDDRYADRIAPDLVEQIRSHSNWTETANEYNALASTEIQTNNIGVTFYAFAGGVIAGLGTVFVLLQNGISIGMVVGLCVKYKFWDILIFMSGHGVIELTAIFISAGGGLLVGKALLIPGDLRRRDALVTNGLAAVKLVMGCIPMLIIAGTIEGFISPAHIPAAYKFSVSAVSAAALIAYFRKPDLRKLRSPA